MEIKLRLEINLHSLLKTDKISYFIMARVSRIHLQCNCLLFLTLRTVFFFIFKSYVFISKYL